jgi:hypothetical protein
MAITLLLAALFGARAAPAQPVYETRDRVGPVFSDLPSAGARAVELPPQINLMDSVEEPAPAPEPVPAVAPYRAVQITQPENGGTVHSNTGQFSIVVAIEPDLRTDQGDRIAITLDGTRLPQRRQVLQFDITAGEWQMAARDQVEHQLEVALVDRAGRVLLTASPIRFYAHRATAGGH